MKWVLTLLFVARITFPMGSKITINDIQRVEVREDAYVLLLANNKTVYVPIMWTMIEEQ